MDHKRTVIISSCYLGCGYLIAGIPGVLIGLVGFMAMLDVWSR